jgi:hypothetical protein
VTEFAGHPPVTDTDATLVPEPDYVLECTHADHPYYGDDFTPDPQTLTADDYEKGRLTCGRCYCGRRRYPQGGRLELNLAGTLDPSLPTREGVEVVVDVGAGADLGAAALRVLTKDWMRFGDVHGLVQYEIGAPVDISRFKQVLLALKSEGLVCYEPPVPRGSGPGEWALP